ncbi:MAG TPA: DNA-3-methyladenine glycosylase I [Verrucomicrobiae bacterium]|nr:DNA-3-methyladenine glycosylase I [Verrucomicrobiae bacterium]
MQRYHDEEWGVPVSDDRKQFEFLVLESAQAGLSWAIVLRKRENYRKAFAGFDPVKVSRFKAPQVRKLLKDPGIIRNRLKIQAAINNARRFLEILSEHGSFANYLRTFVGEKPRINRWKSLAELPARTPESDALSKDMKKRGFKFLGSIVLYSHLQAVGMVNDHVVSCYRHRELKGAPRRKRAGHA